MPTRPSGTVTFLFTDIEGSTKLWEEQPDAMRSALAHHDALLRQAIEAHAGHVFKTVGDAFCAAFATAPAALVAALAAQRALEGGGPRTEDEGKTEDEGRTSEDRGKTEDDGQTTEDRGQDVTLSSPSSVVRPPSTVTLRVRMGLHTGLAEERDGDYFGPPLNRVARLMSAAAGGQVLLSQATYELVRDLLPAGVTLQDLGEHRLKDLIRPERVYQLVAQGLPADFPPIKSLSTHPNNLPAQPTALLGRERELAALTNLLLRPPTRLVTLTGPGGTGKTRLALQVAADLLHHFAQGVFFVDLAPLTDPALVVSAIAPALGVREQPGQPLLDTLKDYLREKQLLLVLDNFEQVVAAARVVADLLAAAPQLKVVVTSREVLKLRGEQEYPVPPLALPPRTEDGRRRTDEIRNTEYAVRITQYAAVALFIERAVAVKPDFQVTNANAPAVAEICYRLDGLPLAIELAAARVKLFPPQTLLQRLGSRLKTLTGGARDLPARQQTLRDAIAWSYDLLTPAEQALFRRLAVFVGGATLEAVEAVCADDEGRRTNDQEAQGRFSLGPWSFVLGPADVLDGLQSLVDKSLIQPREHGDNEPRFIMLETIQEYALEKMTQTGENLSVGWRQAQYFLKLAETAESHLIQSDQRVWLDLLDTEHGNLQAALRQIIEIKEAKLALRLTGALFRFWEYRGYFTLGRKWLEEVLDATPPHDSLRFLRAKALSGVGTLAHQQGDFAQAQTYHQEALNLYQVLGDQQGIAFALNNIAAGQIECGEYTVSVALLEGSLRLYRDSGDETGMVLVLNNLAKVELLKGDYERASRWLEESLALHQRSGHLWQLAMAYNNLGDIARGQSDYKKAEIAYLAGLDLARKVGDKTRLTAWLLHNLGYVALIKRNEQQAREVFYQSAILFQERKGPMGLASCLAGLGGVASLRQEPERAARLVGAAQAALERLNLHLDPCDQTEVDRIVAAVRSQLDAEIFAACWAQGQAMSLEEAMQYALATEDPKGCGNL